MGVGGERDKGRVGVGGERDRRRVGEKDRVRRWEKNAAMKQKKNSFYYTAIIFSYGCSENVFLKSIKLTNYVNINFTCTTLEFVLF